MALLGASAGAAMLTHGRGVAAVLLALLAGAIALLSGRIDLRARAVDAAALVAPLALLALVAFLYTKAHNANGAFGGEVSQATSTGFSLRGFISTTYQFYLPPLEFMGKPPGVGAGYRQIYIEGFFGQQGGLEIAFHHRTFDLIQLTAGAGLIALFVIVVRRFEYLLTRWREVAVMAGGFVLLMFVLHFSDYRDRLGGADALITGRYLLPAVAIYAATIAFVLTSLPRRLGATLGGLLIGSNIVLAIGALGLAVERLNA
jgi:hypothetical protein